MDSMRHLSTSLPPTRRRPQENQPQLLADFKAAALSVTNLYKTAAASQDKARAAGYQDALDDLLAFLDTQELGLMDGEGWRVRQWATERLVDDGMHNKPSPAAGSDDEEETHSVGREEEAAERTSSPEVQRKEPTIPQSSSDLQETSPAATTRPEQSQAQAQPAPSTNDFTFRSTQPYPTNHDREAAGMDIDTTTTPTISTTSSTPTHSPEPTSTTNNIRLVPRSSRRTNHNRHRNTPTINFNLGVGAGSKRKMPYSDFFDIEGFGDGPPPTDRREGGKGNGKRGRHV